jgi:hypothetical protein
MMAARRLSLSWQGQERRCEERLAASRGPRIDFCNITIGFINSHRPAGLSYKESMKTNPSFAENHLETYLPRIVALCLLAALALLVLSGCKSAATADMNPAGVYTLISVNGKTVPCTVQHENTAVLVKSGVFTINTNGTCRSLSIFSVPPHGDVHREVEATYTCQGTNLIMSWKGAGMTKGYVDGNQFTMNNEGMIFSYKK